MSVWRRKRRYEENRRFSERADAALLAIGILRNTANGIKSSRTDEDLRQKLREGRELLEEMRQALRSPEKVDDYTYALAHELCEYWTIVPKDASERLADDIDTLEDVEETLIAVPELEYAEETLDDVEKIAGRISEEEAEQMRDNLVN